MGILNRDKRYWIMVLCICAATDYGCGHPNAPPPNPASQPPAASAAPPPTYGPTAAPPAGPAPAAPSGLKAKYLEFQDIPIPPELDVQSKDSNVFVSGQMKMGFLSLRGRVDSSSVLNFFAAALPHEGWRLKGQFRYNRSLLIFDKPDKVCVILIKEATYYTYVEIYVSPVVGG